jgi:hypothetical protein
MSSWHLVTGIHAGAKAFAFSTKTSADATQGESGLSIQFHSDLIALLSVISQLVPSHLLSSDMHTLAEEDSLLQEDGEGSGTGLFA